MSPKQTVYRGRRVFAGTCRALAQYWVASACFCGLLRKVSVSWGLYCTSGSFYIGTAFYSGRNWSFSIVHSVHTDATLTVLDTSFSFGQLKP